MSKLTEIDELRIEQLAKHFFESPYAFRTATYQLKSLIVRLLETEVKYNERNGVVRVRKVSDILEDNNA
jgi:hypothetical protein